MKQFLWLTLLTVGCSTQQPLPPSSTPGSATPTANTASVRFVLLDGEDKVTEKHRLDNNCHLKLRMEGKGLVVVSTFTGNGDDSPSQMPPEVRELNEGEDVIDWDLGKPIPNGRIYLAVLPLECEKAAELKKLIKGWQDKTAPKARHVVYNNMVAWEQALDKSLRHQGPDTPETGGVSSHSAFPGNIESARPKNKPSALRKAEPDGGGHGGPPPSQALKQLPDWRSMADSVEFSAENPGVYSYPIQFSTK